MLEPVNSPRTLPEVLSRIEAASVLRRIWSGDPAVWKHDPTEIANRLEWLHLPDTMAEALDRIDRFAAAVRTDRFHHVLLLGMGGSSLAPETFSIVFGVADGCPDLAILDTTHPDAVRDVENRLDLDRTLFVVATKSGTTTETLSLFRYFYRRVAERKDITAPGGRFVAITDPGSPLVDLAQRLRFRDVILNDPNLGGRYSALSHFGLVPAALLGVDVRRLLDRARETASACQRTDVGDQNPGILLGALLGAAQSEGRDKVTLLLPEAIAAFGDWVEQLIAESTGKEGTGILPIVREPVAEPSQYGNDRLFVSVRLGDDAGGDVAVDRLADSGHPIVRIDLSDIYDLGGQLFLWEFATAVAGHLLGVNPFDQPNVESAKARARELSDAYRRTGRLPERPSTILTADRLADILGQSHAGDYIAIHAYLRPSDGLTEAFATLRAALLQRSGLATTFGYGPRFLHSTGQLHKGDRGNGRFIQLVADPEGDLAIPGDDEGADEFPLTFGTLIAAQAGGDRQALLDGGRSVATFLVPSDPTDLIRRIAGELVQGESRP